MNEYKKSNPQEISSSGREEKERGPSIKKGRIKSWNGSFGFVQNEERDVFLHYSNLPENLLNAGRQGKLVGTEIEFSVEKGEKGPKAVSVREIVPEVKIPNDLAPVKIEDEWIGEFDPCIHESWNRKRGGPNKTTAALKTREYYLVDPPSREQFDGQTVIHKSIHGFNAFVESEMGAKLFLSGNTAYIFVIEMPLIPIERLQQAARFAGFNEVVLVPCVQFKAQSLGVRYHAFLDSPEESRYGFSILETTGIVDSTGTVRKQSGWSLASEKIDPKKLLEIYLEHGVCSLLESKDFHGLLLMDVPEKEHLDKAIADCERKIDLASQVPIATSVEIFSSDDGKKIVSGIAVVSGKRHFVPIKSKRAGSGFSSSGYSFELDLSEFGRKPVWVRNITDETTKALADAGMISGTNNPLEEIKQSAEQENAKALQDRISQAGKPFLEIQDGLLCVVEYNNKGDKEELKIVEVSSPNNPYTTVVSFKRDGGNEETLSFNVAKEEFVEAAKKRCVRLYKW